MNYKIMKTVICDDCMKGRHEIIGHDDCECVCHNNPQCWICGHNVKPGLDAHLGCLIDYNDQEHDQYLDQMKTKYGEL